eukprot:TRINITY_DN41956_c0_g1_i1.p2 TRINITY_DN41956_c0_g1~~TRINITY_DN41956_c0_g1_i1.p2  ORF type:complete len:101 (+),score=1.52 TRINITY_DN41956_c0_g1_i1:141-443(+)
MYILVRVPRLRKFASVVLGAVTPLLVFFLFVSISYAINPSSKENIFSFYAMWEMCFPFYAALFLVGLVLSFVPMPTNSYARFLIGCASAPVSYALFNLIA